MKSHRLKFIFAVLLATALAGCGGFVRDKEYAASAMDVFHDRFNASEYEKIYDTADPVFQGKGDRAEFLKFIASVHAKLGDYKSCENMGESINSFNSETRVNLHYKTTFARGEGDEQFTFVITGTRATLRDYRIDSPKLGTP